MKNMKKETFLSRKDIVDERLYQPDNFNRQMNK